MPEGHGDTAPSRRQRRGSRRIGTVLLVMVTIMPLLPLVLASWLVIFTTATTRRAADAFALVPRSSRLLPPTPQHPRVARHRCRPLSSALLSSSSSSSSSLSRQDDIAAPVVATWRAEEEEAQQPQPQDSGAIKKESWLASDLERHATLGNEDINRNNNNNEREQDGAARHGQQPLLELARQQNHKNKKVIIYDTTLRDGTQGESISASVDDKVKIARRLMEFGVDYVEAGWPGSNPKDVAFFERAKAELTPEERARLVAFGSTRRKGVRVHEDGQVQALLGSLAPTICLVAKAHSQQVRQVLQASREENLDMIRDTVSYLVKEHNRTVLVDLEHFFDGYVHDAEYALQCCRAAAGAGASCLVLCDTNGGTMPWRLSQVCRDVVQQFAEEVAIGIHTHNDCGMAVANSLLACEAGVGLVQGTINGIGERTGNADLTSIIPSLALHCGAQLGCGPSLSGLTKLSRFVDEILNRTPNQAAPYVGSSAFAHKGGLHVAAMERSSFSYQHVEPEAVGNEKRVLISELSGRQNILGMMEQVIGSSETSPQRANAILGRVKSLEARGYTFEGAEASVRLMILHASRGYCPPFQVLDYSANVYDYNMDSASRVVAAAEAATSAPGAGPSSTSSSTARATVKVRTMRSPADESGGADDVDAQPFVDRLEVADGNGPVDALANALLRALQPSHPYLKNVELVDYKVRILDPESATQASTRVLIEFRDAETRTSWTTVSVDTNVISASLNALIDGFEYALIEHAESCMLCDDMVE